MVILGALVSQLERTGTGPTSPTSAVTAQDSTGSTLSHGWNGKEKQVNDLDLILTTQSFGM